MGFGQAEIFDVVIPLDNVINSGILS